MKRFLFLAMILTLSVTVIVGCGASSSTGPDETTTLTGTVSGVIEAASRSGLGNVSVAAGGVTSQTNENGWFVLSDVPVGSTIVRMTKDGYLTVSRNVTVLENQTAHIGDVSMLTAESNIINSASGGTVAATDGDGSIVLDADSFETESGSPYSGNVEVEIAVMLPDDADFFGAFPGEFEGIREDLTVVPFESYGFMGVNLYSSTGAPLDIADGSTAELTIRISDALARSAPDTMPMWYFDEDDGLWREEGYAVKDGSEYVAEISHLTIWNWDLPLTDICTITGRVVSNVGIPVANATVVSEGVNATYRDEDSSSSNGYFSLRARKNSTADVWAFKGTHDSQTVQVVVGNSSTLELSEDLVLLEPAFSITLTWGADPRDLDSHLFMPMTWDSSWDYFHTAYYNMGTLETNPYTMLDTDDQYSYGPEVISGFNLYEGTYSYYVYLFSGSGSIKQSPTVVNLLVAGQSKTYNATSAGGTVGNYWHVFDFTVNSQGGVSVTNVNTFEAWDYSGSDVWNGSGRGESHPSAFPSKE